MNKVHIKNRYAKHEYEILDIFEAGLELVGDEIKAIRTNRVNLKGSYAKIFYNKKSKPEIFLVGAHFHTETLDPYRTKRLLLHKSEISKLIGKTTEKRLTIVPLSIYIKRGKAKLEIALGKGKKLYDKREQIKTRDINREQNRVLRGK